MIILKHPVTGETKNCPTGISWTCLFLSFFVPLWRRDWKWGLGSLAATLLTFPTGLPIGIAVNAMLFLMYNDLFITQAYKKGFRPVDDAGSAEVDRLLKKYKIEKQD